MNLTNEDVQEILELLDATKFDELHLQTERFKLTLRRNRETAEWSQETQVVSAPNLIQPSTSARPTSASAATPAQVSPTQPRDPRQVVWIDVRAHLPGTFYRAPKPGALPFVEIGGFVEEATVIGIIETMKLMNAVHAETRGEVVEICFDNGQFVKKDAVLMRIKPGAA
jgi:acetyl-CoA carboxylase biotin carboxyl carrier protein